MPSGFPISTGVTCPAEPRVNAVMPYPFGVTAKRPGAAGSGTIVSVSSHCLLWKFTPAAPCAAHQCMKSSAHSAEANPLLAPGTPPR